MPLTTTTITLGPFATHAYLVTCSTSRETAVIDVGFDADQVAAAVRNGGLAVRYLLTTHGHYDHLAGTRELQELIGGEWWMHPADAPLAAALSVQGAMFGLPPAQAPDGMHALSDGQSLPLGEERLSVIHTPGHSPGSVTFRWRDWLWSGDVLFAGSVGRTDLPGGSFATLRYSVRERLFPLGDALRVMPGHGPETTLGEERAHNPFVGDHVEEAP